MSIKITQEQEQFVNPALQRSSQVKQKQENRANRWKKERKNPNTEDLASVNDMVFVEDLVETIYKLHIYGYLQGKVEDVNDLNNFNRVYYKTSVLNPETGVRSNQINFLVKGRKGIRTYPVADYQKVTPEQNKEMQQLCSQKNTPAQRQETVKKYLEENCYVGEEELKNQIRDFFTDEERQGEYRRLKQWKISALKKFGNNEVWVTPKDESS